MICAVRRKMMLRADSPAPAPVFAQMYIVNTILSKKAILCIQEYIE
jgi:hypothetical protein